LEARVPSSSSKTTKAQRKSLRDHIEALDKSIKEKAKAPIPIIKKPNLFKTGQFVKLNRFVPDREKGTIRYIACHDALPSVRKCDKTECEHSVRSYIWVLWSDQKVVSYHYTKLILLTAYDLKPKIGKELSGRIGPWVYTVEKKLWKRDGDDKSYTEEEFKDYMYYEDNPHAKDEGAKLMKHILNMTRPIRMYNDPISQDDDIPIDFDETDGVK